MPARATADTEMIMKRSARFAVMSTFLLAGASA